MTQLSSTQVLCRPAVEADRADVFEFCKSIWDGEDYVPSVWADWLQDTDGLLAVAEYDGHVIGCSKISRLSEGQWWLEGFRVDPKQQGKKVGTHLHHYVTNWWVGNGSGVIRLMTDAGNFAVHHLCEKTGYIKVGEVCAYRAVPLNKLTGSFTPVSNPNEGAAFITDSESLKTTFGLTDLGWRICKPDREIFETALNEDADYFHKFYWWNDGRGFFSAWEEEEAGIRTLFIGVVACELKDLSAFLMEIRGFAALEQFDFIFQIAFDIPSITTQLLAAGFVKKWKRSNACVYEKIHPLMG